MHMKNMVPKMVIKKDKTVGFLAYHIKINQITKTGYLSEFVRDFKANPQPHPDYDHQKNEKLNGHVTDFGDGFVFSNKAP